MTTLVKKLAKNKDQRETNAKLNKSEIDILKSELNQMFENPDDDPILALSEDNSLLKVVKENKTFKLNHEEALVELLSELPCDIDDIRERCEWVIEDLTEHALNKIDIPLYQAHRHLLRSIGYYFASLLTKVEPRRKM